MKGWAEIITIFATTGNTWCLVKEHVRLLHFVIVKQPYKEGSDLLIDVSDVVKLFVLFF